MNQECAQGRSEPVSNVLLGLLLGCPVVFILVIYKINNLKLVIFRGVKISSACAHWMMLSNPSVNM